MSDRITRQRKSEWIASQRIAGKLRVIAAKFQALYEMEWEHLEIGSNDIKALQEQTAMLAAKYAERGR